MMIELCSRRFRVMIFVFWVKEYQPTLEQTGTATKSINAVLLNAKHKIPET